MGESAPATRAAPSAYQLWRRRGFVVAQEGQDLSYFGPDF